MSHLPELPPAAPITFEGFTRLILPAASEKGNFIVCAAAAP